MPRSQGSLVKPSTASRGIHDTDTTDDSTRIPHLHRTDAGAHATRTVPSAQGSAPALLGEEAHQLRGGVRPERVGPGAEGAAAGPGVAALVHRPLLDERVPPAP